MYVSADSARTLVRREKPSPSIAGIAIAALSVAIMPWLAKAKRQVAGTIGSAALIVDSKQADFCAYLSAILLAGLALNALFEWWWADRAAALVMVPIIAKEGVDGLSGNAECGCT